MDQCTCASIHRMIVRRRTNREKEHDNDRRREDGEERMSLGKLSYHLLQLLHMPP